MTQLQTTATRLEFYLVWLALRRVTRSEGAVVEPLRLAMTVFLDRIDVLLDLDTDRDRRRDLSDVLVSMRSSRLENGALRAACARLSDVLGRVVSDPEVPLRRPKIDQITYIRLLQLAVQIRENEPAAASQLCADRLAARASVTLDRVHAAVARMLADGVVHLPIEDDPGPVDAFRMNAPAAADKILFAPEIDREWHPRDARERESEPELTTPNPREVVVIHGRGTARTAFFFELLRRLGLRPLTLDELVDRSRSASPSTRDMVRSAFARAQAVIVLFAGDDLAGLRPDLPRAPGPFLHVIFEAGVAVALQHMRTIIVEMPPLTGLVDLADVHAVRFAGGTPDERHQLVRRLRAAGCGLETDGSTWLNLEFPASPA